jgi:hypothetical protein
MQLLAIDCFPSIESWSDVIEDLLVPCYPNAPGSQNYNLHVKWNFEFNFNV